MHQLFPLENGLKSMKLSPDIIDRIFDEFKFKYLNKKSPTITILKNIYNTYFGKDIIKTTPNKNKEVEYTCDMVANELIKFCKNYLILDKEAKSTYNNLLTDNDVAIEI